MVKRKGSCSQVREALREKGKVRVLFVCLGNICRSPAAEEVFRQTVKAAGQQERWEIDSAGSGNWHQGQLPDPRMRQHASRRGLSLTHRARQVRTSDFYDFDLIVAMDDSNYDDLRSLSPTEETDRKIVRMADFLPAGVDHVPDPYYSGAEGFELVLDLLEEGAPVIMECGE